MRYRQLGRSNLIVPVVSFGAGPISGLMVGQDAAAQLQTISRAVDLGINYFDTAATYGDGRSETSLGLALAELGIRDRVRIATKVRLRPDQLDDIGSAIRQSFEASCTRLGIERVTLLQLHNSITTHRGDLPTSVCVRDVLGGNGVVEAIETLQAEGRVEQLGFTGLGDWASLEQIVRDGPFVAAQVPLNVLLPSAASDATAGSVDVDYLQLARTCQAYGVGVIGIRVLAGGALVGQAPSPHTYKTRFFTLDVFRRDRERAAALTELLPVGMSTVTASLRYVTETLNATTALIGFASPEQVEAAVAASEEGPLGEELVERMTHLSQG